MYIMNNNKNNNVRFLRFAFLGHLSHFCDIDPVNAFT